MMCMNKKRKNDVSLHAKSVILTPFAWSSKALYAGCAI